MKKHKVRSIFLISVGSILIAAAIILTVYNIWDDYRASNAAEEVLHSMKELGAGQIQPSGGQEVPEYVRNPNMDMPTVTIDGYRYIGTVTILPLEVELPVMEEWDYTRMKIAPCRYSGSVYLDNLVICAHNYRSQFGRLDKLQKGDIIVFTDAVGNEFRYAVDRIETLASTSVEEMTSSDWDFTLFTCNYSGRARVTVRCNRAETE